MPNTNDSSGRVEEGYGSWRILAGYFDRYLVCKTSLFVASIIYYARCDTVTEHIWNIIAFRSIISIGEVNRIPSIGGR